MRFEAGNMCMLVFWVVKTCGFADRCQRLGATYCIRIQSWRWQQYIYPKYIYLQVHAVLLPRIDTKVDIFNFVSPVPQGGPKSVNRKRFHVFLVKRFYWCARKRFKTCLHISFLSVN
jgi:hypothetical protein